MRVSQVLFTFCLLALIPFVTHTSTLGRFFHTGLADEAPPSGFPQIRIAVWLMDDLGTVVNPTLCFDDEFLLSRGIDGLLVSTYAGPIGIKEVVDALRLSADEPLDDPSATRSSEGAFVLPPQHLLHVIWQPTLSQFSFYPEAFPPGETIDCGYEPAFPDMNKKAALEINGAAAYCENIKLERLFTVSGTSVISVTVPVNCD